MSKSPVKAERQQPAVKPERLPYNARTRQQVKFEGRIESRQQAKFEGRIESLKGYIYDCTDSRQADLYMKTTREIADPSQDHAYDIETV
jgi:hypothetical protein